MSPHAWRRRRARRRHSERKRRISQGTHRDPDSALCNDAPSPERSFASAQDDAGERRRTEVRRPAAQRGQTCGLGTAPQDAGPPTTLRRWSQGVTARALPQKPVHKVSGRTRAAQPPTAEGRVCILAHATLDAPKGREASAPDVRGRVAGSGSRQEAPARRATAMSIRGTSDARKRRQNPRVPARPTCARLPNDLRGAVPAWQIASGLDLPICGRPHSTGPAKCATRPRRAA